MGIWQFFHLQNNDDALPRDHPDYDWGFKVRNFVNVLIDKWQGVYYPYRDLSVDESIVAFKGRTIMTQYMPMKPHKWGIKAFVLSESKSSYVYNWLLYTGKKPGGTEHGLAQQVVLDLCRPIFGQHHHIYMDNYFSSPQLFSLLSEEQTGACGTLHTNRRGVPPRIRNASMAKGDPPITVRDGNELYIALQDKKQVRQGWRG